MSLEKQRMAEDVADLMVAPFIIGLVNIKTPYGEPEKALAKRVLELTKGENIPPGVRLPRDTDEHVKERITHARSRAIKILEACK